jgi:ATP-binding cassette, subfamily B, bacterial HlyB/CyaB
LAAAMIDHPANSDSGLAGLVMLLRLHGVNAEPEQIRHRFSSEAAVGIGDMLRCAKAARAEGALP